MDSKFPPIWFLFTLLLSLLLVSAAVNANLVQRLNRTRTRAEQLLASKSAAMAVLSHEIRNPLAGVVAVTRALGKTPLNEQQRELVDTLDHSGQELLSLLEETLAHTRLQVAPSASSPGDFAVASFLQKIIAMVENQANEKGLLLFLDIDAALPRVLHGDTQRIRQILLNLLGNAIRFTDSGIVKLQVEKTWQRDGAIGVAMHVIDSGIGIPRAAQRQLFEPFVQVHADGPRYGGTGLGLSISRELARVMGGELSVRSEENRGSTFTLQLALTEQQLTRCKVYPLPLKQQPPAATEGGYREMSG